MDEYMNKGVFEFGNWMLDFSEEWSEWFSGEWNWRNFTLIQIYYEDECHLGNHEVVLRLLGVGVRIVHVYDRDAEGRRIVEDSFAELLEARSELGKSEGQS